MQPNSSRSKVIMKLFTIATLLFLEQHASTVAAAGCLGGVKGVSYEGESDKCNCASVACTQETCKDMGGVWTDDCPACDSYECDPSSPSDVERSNIFKHDGEQMEAGPVTLIIGIKFDEYPGDVSWTLTNTCYGASEVVATGGNYASNLKGQAITKHVSTPDGTFEMQIKDAHGDGLCCKYGNGFYYIERNGEELFKSKLKDPTFGETTPFGSSNTCGPTSNPVDKVPLTIQITFDNYPDDISWELKNTCNGDSMHVASGDHYGVHEKGKTISVFDKTIVDGTFEFMIHDKFGDGLCCIHGTGHYSIFLNNVKEVLSEFENPTKEEIQTFGSSDKCKRVPPTNKASYDSTLGAPKCEVVYSSGTCTTVGTGLLTATTVSGEPNGPNSLDACTDGFLGKHLEDESNEDITITSSSGVLKAGGKAKITAHVYAYSPANGMEDVVDFYHSSSPGTNPNWQYIGSGKPSNGGFVTVESSQFVLSATRTQAVRVNMRWKGEQASPQSCSVGKYNDVDDLVFVVETNSIYDIVSTTDDFSTLTAAINAAQLSEVLSGNGMYTVFAPDNSAFNKLPAALLTKLLNPVWQPQLQDVLLYHTLGSKVLSSDLSEGLVAGTLNYQGNTIVINLNPPRVNDNSNILIDAGLVDMKADNGVVHGVDSVLTPLSVSNNIVDLAVANDNLSTLASAVAAADLIGALSGEGPLTVFAPTNDAFAALPAGLLDSLLLPANVGQLKDILLYHVVTANALSSSLKNGHIETLNGDKATIMVTESGVMVNNASVIVADVIASNGIVHVIDKVLLPPVE